MNERINQFLSVALRALLRTTVVCGATLASAIAQTWIQTSAPTNIWQHVAVSADATKITAVALVGANYTSTDGGSTWNSNSLRLAAHCIASSADGSTLIAVGVQPEGTYISHDAGADWNLVTNMPWNGGLVSSQRWDWRSVACSANAGTIVAGAITQSGPGQLFVSTNAGATWALASAPGGFALASSADGSRLVTGASSDLYTSTISGFSWTKKNGPTGFWWWVTASVDRTKLAAAIAVPDIGRIFTSTNAGDTWTMSGAPAAAWYTVSSSADGSKLVAAAFGGGIYTSVDYGTTWESNSAPIADWISVVSSADGSKLFVLIRGGGIWTAQITPSPVLNIASQNANLALSWTLPSTALILQQTLDTTSTNWVTLSNAAVLNLTNLQNEVRLSLSLSNTFYRLSSP